jgi:hypothetical protein
MPASLKNIGCGFVAFIYGSTPAEFKSGFDLNDSVARLRAATRRSAFGVLAQPAATGLVSESRVRLQRVIPLVGNSFKPFFYGRFEQRGGAVYLIGHFTMLTMVKIFMTLWLGTMLSFGIGFAVMGGGNWQMIVGAAGMFGAGVAIGKWFARNDIAWLSSVISGALDPLPVAQASNLPPQTTAMHASSAALPMALRLAAVFLLFTGVMCVWSAVAGHTVTTYSSSPGVRTALGASWLTTILPTFTSPQFPERGAFRVIFSALSFAVTVYWGWWWFAQRIYFSGGTDRGRGS